MDVGRAFTFAFEDPDWLKKLLIGGALLFIPIFGWLVVGGYWMRIIRSAYVGNDVPLPEWDQFGDDFVLGLKGAVAILVWWLPFYAIIGTMFCLTIPFWLSTGTSHSAVFVPLAIFGTFGWIGLGMVSMVMQIVMLVVPPVVLGRIAINGDFAAGFQFRDMILEMRRVPMPLFMVVALEYGIRSVTGFGIIFCVVGLAFTTFGGYVMLSHLYGQLRRVVEESGEVTSPVVTL